MRSRLNSESSLEDAVRYWTIFLTFNSESVLPFVA